ncbi:hypothetical protein J6590_045720 [Homalodisca vitripennis]|nr:hypothetical protein J6590_045720 [Homalodisca vitripennis]
MVSATGFYILLIFAYVSAVESLDTFESAANRDALKQKPELHPFILPRNLRSWAFIKPRLGKRTMEDSEGLYRTDSPWDSLENLEIQGKAYNMSVCK